MKIHHIGYLVDNIDAAATTFENLGFSLVGKIEEDTTREIYIQFLDNDGFVVELIQPVSKKSPYYGLCKKYRNSPYHICYATDNLSEEIEIMVNSESGNILLQPPKPAPAMPGHPYVAFLMNEHIGMIELVDMKIN